MPTDNAHTLSYVIVTPARNEAAYIDHTLRAVTSQSRKPVIWVIVSDGSTDGTDAIVLEHAKAHPWIELVRLPERRERHFAGKVNAFNAGYERARRHSHDVLVSLDADISFERDYFEYLLERLSEDHSLGLVGTPFRDESMYDYRFVSTDHVSGACQVFRRECFEAIGGYIPMALGGIDHAAVISARMKGWRTKTFVERVSQHHRRMGSALHGRVRARFRDGTLDYALGSSPLWQVCRTLYQMTRRPIVVGGVALLAGYTVSAIRRPARPVSAEFVAFRRQEQMNRLSQFLSRRR